jgi:hypothetical protein
MWGISPARPSKKKGRFKHSGIAYTIADLRKLFLNKRATGRIKDIADAEMLEGKGK